MDAIIKVVEDWSRAKDQQLPTTAIFFDFSKAFDLVDHEILLSKLSQMLPEWITSWIAAYLTSRTQRVKTGDIFTEWKPVEAGVIQGTILGPIMFLIFISDINQHVPNGVELIKYADDLLAYISSKTWQCDLIQGAAKGIENWCRLNKMKLNSKKCLEMIMPNGHPDPCPPTTLAGREIGRTDSYKYLGIQINSDLDWGQHWDHIHKKISSAPYLLRQLRHQGFKLEVLLSVYRSKPLLHPQSAKWKPSSSERSRPSKQTTIRRSSSLA